MLGLAHAMARGFVTFTGMRRHNTPRAGAAGHPAVSELAVLAKLLVSLGSRPLLCNRLRVLPYLRQFGNSFAPPQLVVRLGISAKDEIMRTSGLVLWSGQLPAFLRLQLSAQSAEERVEELTSYAKPFMWAGLSNPSTAHVFVLPEGTQIPLEFVTPVSTRTAKRNDR